MTAVGLFPLTVVVGGLVSACMVVVATSLLALVGILVAGATVAGLLILALLFDDWSATSYGSMESQLLSIVSVLPTSLALGAAGFGLRRLLRYMMQSARSARRASRPL